jgi:hypothetical protein
MKTRGTFVIIEARENKTLNVYYNSKEKWRQ